jgi:predicted RNA-binding Zn ribbon-like protein
MSQIEFIGEALAFDFVNTEMVVRRKPVDLLSTPDALLVWWNAALDHYQMSMPDSLEITDEVFEKARVLRGALRRIFTAIVGHAELDSADLDILNIALSAGHPRLIAMPDQRFGINQVSDEANAMLLTIAHSAAWLLTECERERLHKCKNERCVLMFLDTTKNGNRVWCSIDCMNRARSIEHYQHSKH